MNEVVLDASVVMQWFVAAKTPKAASAASDLRKRFETGSLRVLVPQLLFLEVLNVAGRRWGWEVSLLLNLAVALEAVGFEVADPDLTAVAEWTARGLTAYDATYVAIAEERGIPC